MMTESNNFEHIKFAEYTDEIISSPKPDFNSLWVFNPILNIDFFQLIPKQFTISTNNQSYNFNIEMLKDTSSIISQHIKDFPDNLNYHLNIEDKNNILEEIYKVYQGETVVIYPKDYKEFNQFLTLLDLTIPKAYHQIQTFLRTGLLPEGGTVYLSHCEHPIKIIKKSFCNFISNISFQTFTIVTNKFEYKCNSFKILCSKVIYNFLLQNPTEDHYKYDFKDEFSEFQLICDFFNSKMVEITFDNINSLKQIAEELEITPVYDYLKKYESVMNIINDQQLNAESIEKLFYHLYHINELTLSKVKEFIVNSEWSSTIEKVKELSAFILHVVKSDFSLHQSITDLLIELNNEEDNQSNQLSFLLPFIVRKLMDSFDGKKCYLLMIYNLRKKGIISEKEISIKLQKIIQKMRYSSDIKKIINYFLPDIYQINKDIVNYFIRNTKNLQSSFIKSYLPNDLDKYKKMLDSGEPDDKLTLILRQDDVDSLCAQLSIIDDKIDILHCTVRYNIYEKFVENGKTNYLNYAAAYGSVKCFKYLLLNNFDVDELTFKYAINGGNFEIIRIVDQRMHQKINPKDIFQAIKKHQNNIFDWILEERIEIKSKTNKFFKELAVISNKSGNVHSLFKLIIEGYDLFKDQLTIQYSNENGFCTLSQIIFDILSINELQNFSKISRSFALYGNLSIFLLSINFLDQNDVNICLKHAVEFSFIEIIEYIFQNLIMKKFEIDIKTIEEILTISSLNNEYDLFNYMINEFLTINPLFYKEIQWMKTLLPNSCTNGKIKIVEKIVEFILKINSTEKDITMSFINAALFEYLDILDYFTNVPLIVNYEQLSNSSQIMKSISSEVFSFIIEKSPANLKDAFLLNFIYAAIRNKNKGLTEYILKQNNEFENSLIEAVKTNELEMVELVLKYNSNSNIINRIVSKITPLCIATINNNLSIVQRLLSCENIDINLNDKLELNPLQIACYRNCIEICKILLQFDNIDLNYQCSAHSGNTPLIISIENRNWEISEMLLNHPKTKLDVKNFKDEDAKSIEIRSDQPKIVKMFADRGNSAAMYRYGNMLYSGINIEVNKKEAGKYFKMSIDNGNLEAANSYGLYLLHKKNNEEACKYFKIAADREDLNGLHNYGHMLKDGIGIEANKQESIKYFKMAAEKGNILSMIYYGCLLQEGKDVPIDKEKAVEYFRSAANKGNAEGMCRYAYALINGIGINVDKEEAAKYYKKAIDKGFSQAAVEYGYHLEKGIGFEVNKEEAKTLYKLAADKGNVNGINNYGWICFSMGSTNEDYEEAIKYLKKASDLGYLISLVNYGYMVDNGYGIQCDHEEARKCYQKVIEKGGTKEIFTVAEILENGNGIQKNEKEAARLYKLAADAGHSDSMFNYAKMAENGCGIQTNKEEAIQY